MTEKRYCMEYVNCEVSTIIDTIQNEELTAEQIVDLLNENEQLKQSNNDLIQQVSDRDIILDEYERKIEELENR